ncbi:SUMF1/EgtB/PvdO family nonheme iron enzyme [uncultured Thiodictyon sp.]|uniref:SUMF1/EgtB/PvdO family nonheme iron enzyme n=1 Tax=uncultured Thiodictyon sp. TaxID=1846217 RepID=UPI0025EB8BE5|nr:SUMF1/EgtB/PvdO family nonheme iron enzyme [uncultured Thiodictyon sp.]
MAAPLILKDPRNSAENADELRATLEQMRLQAEREIARLSRKLAERELAAVRDVPSATERQALQQDLAILRHSLGAKEKTLDQITQECRRLEDDLEDRHQEVDNLKQEAQRRDNALTAARNEINRLKGQLAEIQEQSMDAAALHDPREPRKERPPPPVQSSTPARPPPKAIAVSAGLIAGLGLIVLVVVVSWGRITQKQDRWEPSLTPPTAQIAPTKQPLSEVPPPAQAPVMPLPPAPAPTEQPANLNDRLRDGSFGPTIVELNGGSFQMGRNNLGGGDNGPEHEVQLPPFLIGAYEVTFQEYDHFARATGQRLPDDFGWGRGERPVVGVSWIDAQAYTDWLTRQTGKRYRLPSEAEWEYAAQANTPGIYPWGFVIERGRANCFDCGSRWDNRSTAPVGSFAPNAFGLYDTAGNALEWVADCYAPGYDGAPSDGSARTAQNCTERVARGGAFNKPAPSLKNKTRARFVPYTRLNNLGFRVAREP